MKTNERWTAEENRLLLEVCAEKLSGAQIAAEMRRRTGSQRFTHGAIVGRTRRAGISLPLAAGSNQNASCVRDFPKPKRIAAPPSDAPVTKRHKPGRLLLNLGWLDGAFGR
jgi:hypothetical protein